MTTYYSNEYDQLYQSVPKSLVSANKLHGRMRVAYAQWNTGSSASHSSSDEIYLFKLPAGARILPGMGRLIWDKFGSSVALSFGYASSSAALASKSEYSLASAGQNAFPKSGVVFSSEQTIKATFKSVTSVSNSANLEAFIAYVVD